LAKKEEEEVMEENQARGEAERKVFRFYGSGRMRVAETLTKTLTGGRGISGG